MARYEPDHLITLAARLAAAAGVPPADAQLLAEALVDADLHGKATHGLSRLAIYLERIEKKLIDPDAPLRVEHRRPAVLSVDAGNGLGQVQAVKTLATLLPLAQTHGVAAATIRQSQHFGVLGYYGRRLAAQQVILLASTTCEPALPPEGSSEAFFGTNPIACVLPTGRGFVATIDLSSSIVARGNIIAAQREGRPIPLGWAIDPDGNPTTDAAAALAGAVLPMAGHKGYALALLVEVLSGVLSGSAIGPDIGSMYKHMDRQQNVGHFFCLLDIAAFLDPAEFKRRIDQTIDRIKACRRRAGVQEILIPGERAARCAVENQRQGLALSAATVQDLQRLARQYGVPFDLAPASPSCGDH